MRPAREKMNIILATDGETDEQTDKQADWVIEPQSWLHLENKAGYTPISCGRVGRGGIARFPTFRLDHLYGLTDQPTNQPTDGQSLF